MGRHRGIAKISTSVRVSPEFHKLAVDNFISFSEAITRGISLMLAERGIREYDNQLNIVRLLNETKLKSAEYAKKLFELEEKIKHK